MIEKVVDFFVYNSPGDSVIFEKWGGELKKIISVKKPQIESMSYYCA